MDNFLPDNSIINISNGVIDSIDTDNNTSFITVNYTECINCTQTNKVIKLIADRNTRVSDENGNRTRLSELTPGMIINASFSSAMTRSIPPQAKAFLIQIVRRPLTDNITIGRILEVNRQNRYITTISNGNPALIIRFNVPYEARILDLAGRPINFSRLIPGLRVRIKHAAFMTASIPPQTTAFEIQIIR